MNGPQNTYSDLESELSGESDGAEDDSDDRDYEPSHALSDDEARWQPGKRRKIHASVSEITNRAQVTDGSAISLSANINSPSIFEPEVTQISLDEAAFSPALPIIEIGPPNSLTARSQTPVASSREQPAPIHNGHRLMALNAAGILDLDKSSAVVFPVGTWPSAPAPIAASPTDATAPRQSSSNTGQVPSTQISSAQTAYEALEGFEAELEEDKVYKQAFLKSINHQRDCMRQFICHTITGCLQALEQRKEISALKRTIVTLSQEMRDKVQNLHRSEDKIKLQITNLKQELTDSTGINETLKRRIEILETDTASLAAELAACREKNHVFMAELEGLRDHNSSLEQNLTKSTTNEVHLGLEVDRLRQRNQHLIADRDILTTQQESLRLLVEKLEEENKRLQAENTSLHVVKMAQADDLAARTLTEEDLNSKIKTLQQQKSSLEAERAEVQKAAIDLVDSLHLKPFFKF
ncbi:hypothetical protein Dda_0660 [Drechslerella dactyloides]|uniref:Uncharacterized protein n=1 Tax=Drechslerella dactyloides TaxID=74499 RepID=A0AAD6J4V7_DREDA|nr:hypothetical protein Dda_0660 [Drechslerella dactyloides]